MGKMKLILLVGLCVMVAITGCKKSSTGPVDDDGPAMLNVYGAYMGATPPGSTVVRFAPDASLRATSSWFYHGSPIFSPDGNEMYFVKYFTSDDHTEIWFTKRINDQWTVAQKASFSQGGFVNNPFFVGNDNDTLYFKSNMNGYWIHKVTRMANGWSSPTSLAISLPTGYTAGHDFCVLSDGSVYFSVNNSSMSNNGYDIFVSRLSGGVYTTPESVTIVNTPANNEWLGYVDPSETYMLFVSNRPGGSGMHDVYISRKAAGIWNTPVNLGISVNGTWEDSSPNITSDGNYLFFTTEKSGDLGYTPYWVSSSVLPAP